MINLNMLCLHGDLYLSAWSNRIAMELEQEKIDTVAAKKMRKGFSRHIKIDERKAYFSRLRMVENRS